MNESSNTNSCVIELHYCLKDNSHSMDAFIFNECEREFLNIVRNVAQRLGVNVEVRTEALGKGGICCWLTFISLDGLCTAIDIAQVIIIFFNTPIGKAIYNKALERIKKRTKRYKRTIVGETNGNVETKCETAKSESEPYKRVIDTEKLYQLIDKDIEKNRSDFCANLILCGEVKGLTIRVINKNGNECFPKEEITTDDIKGFILPNNNVVPEYVNDAEIEEITLPAVITGRHKWRGVYNGRSISFDMRSNDFKKAVQSGQISIKDCASIRCNLKIRRKIDNEGNIKIIGYEVTHVYNE